MQVAGPSPAGLGYVVDATRPRSVLAHGLSSVIRCFVEAWQSRELLYMHIARDIKVRYRAAALGILWALLTPLLSILVFTIFFGILGRMGPEGLPYPIFLFSALVVWHYFDSSIGRASNALISNSSLLSKVYFPRQLLPFSSVVSTMFDLLFSFIVLLVMLLIYRVAPTWRALLLPAYFALAVVAATGMGLSLSVLNAFYRDVRHFMPVLMRLWFFCSPVLYGVELVPERWRPVYAINPMVSVCEGFRSSLLRTTPPTLAMVSISGGVALTMLIVGVFIFRGHEETVADVL